MSLTIGRINRAGTITFGDATLSIYEDGISAARAAGGWPAEKAWERQFKRDVFARIVQTLHRIGWTVGPWDKADQYKAIALGHRTCSKGDLKGELDVSGRCIKFEMWQDVTPPENSNGAVLYAALDMSGRVVYSHENLENVEMNSGYIKTPTRIVGLAAIAARKAAGSAP